MTAFTAVDQLLKRGRKTVRMYLWGFIVRSTGWGTLRVTYHTSSESQEFVLLGNMYYRWRLVRVICRKRRRKKKIRFVRTVLLATVNNAKYMQTSRWVYVTTIKLTCLSWSLGRHVTIHVHPTTAVHYCNVDVMREQNVILYYSILLYSIWSLDANLCFSRERYWSSLLAWPVAMPFCSVHLLFSMILF